LYRPNWHLKRAKNSSYIMFQKPSFSYFQDHPLHPVLYHCYTVEESANFVFNCHHEEKKIIPRTLGQSKLAVKKKKKNAKENLTNPLENYYKSLKNKLVFHLCLIYFSLKFVKNQNKYDRLFHCAIIRKIVPTSSSKKSEMINFYAFDFSFCSATLSHNNYVINYCSCL